MQGADHLVGDLVVCYTGQVIEDHAMLCRRSDRLKIGDALRVGIDLIIRRGKHKRRQVQAFHGRDPRLCAGNRVIHTADIDRHAAFYRFHGYFGCFRADLIAQKRLLSHGTHAEYRRRALRDHGLDLFFVAAHNKVAVFIDRGAKRRNKTCFHVDSPIVLLEYCLDSFCNFHTKKPVIICIHVVAISGRCLRKFCCIHPRHTKAPRNTLCRLAQTAHTVASVVSCGSGKSAAAVDCRRTRLMFPERHAALTVSVRSARTTRFHSHLHLYNSDRWFQA